MTKLSISTNRATATVAPKRPPKPPLVVPDPTPGEPRWMTQIRDSIRLNEWAKADPKTRPQEVEFDLGTDGWDRALLEQHARIIELEAALNASFLERQAERKRDREDRAELIAQMRELEQKHCP